MNKLTIKILLIILLFQGACTQNTTQKSEDTIFNIQDKSEILLDDKTYALPKSIGFVNDFAKVFTAQQVKDLTTLITDFEEKTSNQIAIVTINVNELNDSNFDEFSLALANYWGVGQKDKNNGLTIVFSPNLKRIRINTGLGTEKILTDKICENVLQTLIIPEFQKGNYADGIELGTKEFIRLWK